MQPSLKAAELGTLNQKGGDSYNSGAKKEVPRDEVSEEAQRRKRHRDKESEEAQGNVAVDIRRQRAS